MAHARLSPSDSARWLHCQFGIWLDDRVRDANGGELPDDSNEHSERGSELHEIAAWKVKAHLGMLSSEGVGGELADTVEELVIKYDDQEPEALDHVAAYVDYCLAIEHDFDSCGVEVSAELWYEPGSSGTTDFWGFNEAAKRLTIVDAKFGQRVVSPKNNTQLAIYALSIIDRLQFFHDIEEVELVIFQPKHSLEPKSYVVKVGELRLLREVIDRAAALTTWPFETPPAANPSWKACEWCAHKGKCPGKIAEADGARGFEPAQATDAEISELHRRSDQIAATLQAVREEIQSRVDDFPYWKMAPGNLGNKVWKPDADEALSSMCGELDPDLIYTEPKLKSYTAIVKVIKGAFEKAAADEIIDALDEQYEQKRNKDVLVPSTKEEREAKAGVIDGTNPFDALDN